LHILNVQQKEDNPVAIPSGIEPKKCAAVNKGILSVIPSPAAAQ